MTCEKSVALTVGEEKKEKKIPHTGDKASVALTVGEEKKEKKKERKKRVTD